MWLFGHKPHWLYELMPWLYIAGGMGALVVLDTGFGASSALLLVLAGANIWWLRKHNRKQPRARGNNDAALVGLVWLRSYECGNASIDAEHKALFEKSHLLLDAALTGEFRDARALLDELIEDIETHFVSEEEILAGISGSMAHSHSMFHRKLLASLIARRDEYQQGKLAWRGLIHFVLFGVIVKHVAHEEKTAFAKLFVA